MSRGIDEAKRREWQARFERFRNSGVTVGRFCSAERVSVNSFYYWAKRLESPSAPAELQIGSRRLPSAATKVGGARTTVPETASRPDAAASGDGASNSATTVRFLLGDRIEIVVPADRLDVVRCLARCLRRRTSERATAARSAAFHEVVVAAR